MAEDKPTEFSRAMYVYVRVNLWDMDQPRECTEIEEYEHDDWVAVRS